MSLSKEYMAKHVYVVSMSGGSGTRQKPYNWENPQTMIPKFFVEIFDRPFLKIQLDTLQEAGIRDIYFNIQQKEGVRQLKRYFNHPLNTNFNAHFPAKRSPSMSDVELGSATSLLTHLWDDRTKLFDSDHEYVIVLPNDNLHKLDYAKAVEAHIKSKVPMTILTNKTPLNKIINKYGVLLGKEGILSDPNDFVEKPNIDKLVEIFGVPQTEFSNLTADANTAACIITLKEFHDNLPQLTWISRKMKEDIETKGLDVFGLWKDFSKSFLASGYKIGKYPIDSWYEFGDRNEIISTATTALADRDNPFTRTFIKTDRYVELQGNVWIHKDVMGTKVNGSGKTVEDMINNDLIHVGPNVRIGRDVVLGKGVTIANSNIDSGSVIDNYATIEGSVLWSRVWVGEHARIIDSGIGAETEIDSSQSNPVTIEKSHIGTYCKLPGGDAKGVTHKYLGLPTSINLGSKLLVDHHEENPDSHHWNKSYQGTSLQDLRIINHEKEENKQCNLENFKE